MSITSLCNRFAITMERESDTTDAHGGVALTWSTGNRGGLATTVQADMQTATADERIEYGIRETSVAWCMYTASDPKLETEDRITWTDNSGIARICRVKNPSFDMAGRNSIWRTVVQENQNWN
jgi:hypothetical protein